MFPNQALPYGAFDPQEKHADLSEAIGRQGHKKPLASRSGFLFSRG
jgi:hypothetical protein